DDLPIERQPPKPCGRTTSFVLLLLLARVLDRTYPYSDSRSCTYLETRTRAGPRHACSSSCSYLTKSANTSAASASLRLCTTSGLAEDAHHVLAEDLSDRDARHAGGQERVGEEREAARIF